MKTTILIPLFILPLISPLTSCREKGPAERAGESIDNAAEEVKDVVEPKGPVEKAGEKIDNAVGN